MPWFNVTILDSDGCVITQTEERSLSAAKRSAIEKLNEPGHCDARKAIVSNADTGEVLWDRFVVTPLLRRMPA
jgi:hypothetical protein